MKIKKAAIVYMKHGTKEHLSCIKYAKSELEKRNILFGFYARENLSFSKLSEKDLIVVVGGDGTFLKASHFIEGNQIIFGINSDPNNKEGFFLRTFKKDFVKKHIAVDYLQHKNSQMWHYLVSVCLTGLIAAARIFSAGCTVNIATNIALR